MTSTPWHAFPAVLMLLVVPLAGCASPAGTTSDTNGTVSMENDTLLPEDETPAVDVPEDETPPSDVPPDENPVPEDPPSQAELCDPTVADPDADPDRDGLTNKEEVWWGSDPANADTDGDGVNDGAEVATPPTPPAPPEPGMDWDGDALPDGAEACVLGTDATLYSTDGDFYGDGHEYYGTQFVRYVQNHGGDTYTRGGTVRDMPAGVPRNPFQPAVPDLLVEVTNPVFVIDETYVEGNKTASRRAEEIKGTGYVAFNSKAWVEGSMSHTVTSEAGWPPWKNKASTESQATIELGFRAELSGGVAFNWERSKQVDDSAFTIAERDFSNSELQANLRFTNVGNDALRDELKEVLVNFYVGDELVNTWRYSDKPAKIENVGPGESFVYGPLQVKLTYQQYLAMRSGRALTAEVVHFSYGLDQLMLKNVVERTVKVTVAAPDEVRVHHVAVGDDPTPLETVYKWIGEMEVEEVNGRKRITSVDGLEIVQNEKPPFTYWTITTTHRDGPEDPDSQVYSDLLLRGGDQVLIRWDRDTDGDLLVDQLERAYSSDLNDVDTDDDGLWDGEEVLGVRRNQEDVDARGWLPPDASFTESQRSNPFLKDSDGDNVLDPDDPDPMERFVDSWEMLHVRNADDAAMCRFTPLLDPRNPTDRENCGGWGPIVDVAGGDLDGDGFDDVVTLYKVAHYEGGRDYNRCGYHWDGPWHEEWRSCWDVTCSVNSGKDGRQLVDKQKCGTLYANEESSVTIENWGTHSAKKVTSVETGTSGRIVAVANVDEKPGAEIIIGNGGAPRKAGDSKCTVWRYDEAQAALVAGHSFDCGFGIGAHLATGEFEADHYGREEVLVARGWTEECTVYNGNNGLHVQTFKCGFLPGWAFAVGDVTGDELDEVVSVLTYNPPTCRLGRPGSDVQEFACGENPAWNDRSVIIAPMGAAHDKEQLVVLERSRWQCVTHDFVGDGLTEWQERVDCLSNWRPGASELVALAFGNFLKDAGNPA